MVFEDFHYADSGLLDFVDHLVEWSRACPIYVVTLARPELIEQAPRLGRRQAQLHLDVPGPACRKRRCASCWPVWCPGLPEPAVKAIVARADGMPALRRRDRPHARGRGRLAREDGVYRPVGDLTTLAVPETLTALIASRLDGLDPEDRSLIHDAAVLGQSFTPAALAAVSGMSEADLEPHLRALVRRELLTLATDPHSPGRGQYAFVQALIREVAYGTLAKADRKAKHLAAARFFESLGSDELAGALAGHYLAAYQNAPAGPEAEALAGQARLALGGAAERAGALGAHDQAVRFLEQAISVTKDPVAEAELLERAGASAEIAGRYDEAKDFLDRALEIHGAAGDRHAAARATAILGRTLLDGHRTDVARKLLEQAAPDFADLVDDPGVIALQGQLARAYFFDSEQQRAIEMADRVLAAAERADLQEIIADTLVTKGTAFCNLGRTQEGLGVIEIGERLARATGSTKILLRALFNHSVQGYEGDPAGTLEACVEGLALARRVGDRGSIAGFTAGLSFCLYHKGDWDRALVVLDSALAEDLDRSDRSSPLGNALMLHVFRGEPVDLVMAELEEVLPGLGDLGLRISLLDVRATVAFAQGHLREAIAGWHEEIELDPLQTTWVLPLSARAALWLGDTTAARADVEALDMSGRHGSVAALRRRTIRAGLAALEDPNGEALALFRAALRDWRELGLAWEEALCGIDMATLLDPALPDVQAAIESAREILTHLQARPFLDRLEAAASRKVMAPAPAPSVPSIAPAEATADR